MYILYLLTWYIAEQEKNSTRQNYSMILYMWWYIYMHMNIYTYIDVVNLHRQRPEGA